jgi:hypothetical protein
MLRLALIPLLAMFVIACVACGGSQTQASQPAQTQASQPASPAAAADGDDGDEASVDDASLDAWKEATKSWGVSVMTSFDDIMEWLSSPSSIEAFLNGDPATTQTVLEALEAWDHCSVDLASFPETPHGFENVQTKMEQACRHFDDANNYFMHAVNNPDYADSIGDVSDGIKEVDLGARAMTDVPDLLEQAVADSDL